MIDFGREVCGRPELVAAREWLVTNGIGGYAAGTIGGMLTRRYHGLLIAALRPPLGRTLTLAKLDETADYGGETYVLSANRWTDGSTDPAGFRFLQRFHLEGTIPTWTYACGDALLVKRVWMEQGANTTYVNYHLERASGPMALALAPWVTYRDHHDNTDSAVLELRVSRVANGLRVQPEAGGQDGFLVLSYQAVPRVQRTWRQGIELHAERLTGLPAREDLLQLGVLRATLYAGQSVTVVASTQLTPSLDGQVALQSRENHERELLKEFNQPDAPWWVERLVLAADQFVVRRSFGGNPDGRTVIAGYPWFGDRGRDTMISLPGLTLSTGQTKIAALVLRTYAHHVDRGMIPNRFSEEGNGPEYDSVDATLWYIEAIRAYYEATGDIELVGELFPILQDLVVWHLCGTRHQIRVDPADGLLHAGEPGVQLTWMDAKVGDWVVTPRIGKPVEVNALWYNSLRTMARLAGVVGQDPSTYASVADQVQAGFARFWNPAVGYCFDVLDGPEGNDASLRPNQLLAVSLAHSPFSPVEQKAIVDVCARRLLTSFGLRSLASDDGRYRGSYAGDQWQRDAAYHQGTVWAWLIGPFVRAHLRVYRDAGLAESFLWPMAQHLCDHGLGSISEVFEGDPPFGARGCFAQAWSVAEVLRSWQLVSQAGRDPSRIEALL